MISSECQDELPLQEAFTKLLEKKQQKINISINSESNFESDLLWKRIHFGQPGEIIQVAATGDFLFIMGIKDGCTNLCKLNEDLQWETVATCGPRDGMVKQMVPVVEGAGNDCLFLIKQTESGIAKLYVYK